MEINRTLRFNHTSATISCTVKFYNIESFLSLGCWRPNYDGSSNPRGQRGPLSQYGDYSCDSTWELIESAARMMMTRQNENVEFVLWTG